MNNFQFSIPIPIPIPPPPVRLIRSPNLWIEGNALDQLNAIASLDGVTEVVGLPDLQPGRGYAVGSATRTLDRLIPILIDKDIGCGMLFASFGHTRPTIGKIARKLNSRFFSWTGLPVSGPQLKSLLEHPSSWPGVLDGLFPGSAAVAGQHLRSAYGIRDADLGAICDVLPDVSLESSAMSIGTIGEGNHFIEIQRIAELKDALTAGLFGLAKGDASIIIHSGSRSFGYALVEIIFREAKDTETGKAIPPDSPLWPRYLAMMQAALNYAALNRLVLLLRMRDFADPDSLTILLDKPHNFAELMPIAAGQTPVIHRKGAAPAHFLPDTPDPVVIPGSMGNESWFCIADEGAAHALDSVNHGVGRKWMRTVAAEKLHQKARERGMRAVTGKGEVVCPEPDHLFEEGGDGYKNVESVMACAEQAKLIRRVARLEPLLTMRE